MEVDVTEIIRDEIARYGIITVARFMELALYEPGSGYYRRERFRFGRGGDFYTAEQLQPLFGDLIAAYAAKLANLTAAERWRFSILEIGAGAGDMRSALAQWNYRGFDWSGDPLPDEMHGLILANEFFDALPVHLLVGTEEKWHELGVRLSGERITLEVMRLSSPALLEYARRYAPSEAESNHLEACLDAAKWMARFSHLHKSGTLLIFDYGYSAQELIRFPQGTLMSYRSHVASDDFLSDPGERDITAHVNFSYLTDLALQHGYRVEADLTLRRWLYRVWSESEFESLWRAKDSRWRLQWKQLSAGMGEAFRVLELSKLPHRSK